jgi:hypothetical protein
LLHYEQRAKARGATAQAGAHCEAAEETYHTSTNSPIKGENKMSNRLDQIAVEMRTLCNELETANDGQRENLTQRAESLCSELENDYGVPAFRPEVPQATQDMFFKLAGVVFEV